MQNLLKSGLKIHVSTRPEYRERVIRTCTQTSAEIKAKLPSFRWKPSKLLADVADVKDLVEIETPKYYRDRYETWPTDTPHEEVD